MQDNEEKKQQNKNVNEEEKKQPKKYDTREISTNKDKDNEDSDNNYRKDNRRGRGRHSSSSRGNQRYSRKSSSKHGGNYRKNYSRKKVSRLYKLLGSSKKLWDEKIDYKNVDFLRNFITESGKIAPRRTTGVSPLYHRKLVREIKKARSIALLPFRVQE